MSPKQLSRDETKRLYHTKTYILTNLDQDLHLKKLARLTLMGDRKFKDGFEELFGISPGRFVRESRMQMALFLLYHTDKPIKDIAAHVGYKKTNNFSRAFKAFFKVTAASVRE